MRLGWHVFPSVSAETFKDHITEIGSDDPPWKRNNHGIVVMEPPSARVEAPMSQHVNDNVCTSGFVLPRACPSCFLTA